jgi:hypothetical protein
VPDGGRERDSCRTPEVPQSETVSGCLRQAVSVGLSCCWPRSWPIGQPGFRDGFTPFHIMAQIACRRRRRKQARCRNRSRKRNRPRDDEAVRRATKQPPAPPCPAVPGLDPDGHARHRIAPDVQQPAVRCPRWREERVPGRCGLIGRPRSAHAGQEETGVPGTGRASRSTRTRRPPGWELLPSLNPPARKPGRFRPKTWRCAPPASGHASPLMLGCYPADTPSVRCAG